MPLGERRYKDDQLLSDAVCNTVRRPVCAGLADDVVNGIHRSASGVTRMISYYPMQYVTPDAVRFVPVWLTMQ
jgi:hypothetical protein